MADDMSSPPLVYEGLDPSPEAKSTIAEVSDAVRGAANRVGDAIEKGKKPGMPLSVLSNIAREAPLAAGGVPAGCCDSSASLRRMAPQIITASSPYDGRDRFETRLNARR